MFSLIDNFQFSINVILPVFLIVGIGYLLKVKNVIDDGFVMMSYKVVFNVALPMLVFMELSVIDASVKFDWNEIILVYGVTFFFFFFSWGIAKIFLKDPGKIGAFVQGSFRSNIAVIGFALILNLYGDTGLTHAAILLAFLMPLYNVLSIIVLTYSMQNVNRTNPLQIILEILKNPLIIAAIISILFSYCHIQIHPVIKSTGEYLASLSLPLALIGIGGSMNIKVLRNSSSAVIYATIIKNLLLPLVTTIIAVYMGYREMVLGIIFIMIASPSAIVSYIMAKAMGADSEVAGNIVLLTTLSSVLTLSLGIFILRSLSLI